MANRIHLKGDYRQEEAYAAAAGMYPGMLVQLDSAGKIAVHSTEGGRGEKAFATEDALQGKTVDTVYTVSTIATYILPVSGGVVNALIKDGEEIAIGDELVSGGDGTLVARSNVSSGVTVAETIAIAEEARDLTGSNSSNTLSAVRVK